MVAIFTGLGAGFTRGSGNLLGGLGQLGGGVLGRAGEGVAVNAASGNLLVSRQDEFLAGLGPDVAIGRTYNSQIDAADGDNGDQWQQSTTRRVFGLTGMQDTAGNTISRLSGDGSVLVYSWDAGRAAYVSKEGSGAFDTLTHSGGVWTWKDGDSGSTESYAAHGTDNWRITAAADTDGNTLSFTYVGDKLDKVTTADGAWTQYGWTGNAITSVVTGYTDLATSTAKTLTRVRYAYDGQGRLQTVTNDLTPDDNSVATGPSYVTTYTYHGTSNRIASIAQSDGSLLQIAYDGSDRVQTLTQTVASGVTRVTTLTYGANYTTVTGPDGQVTRLDYDAARQLTKITAPPAASGAAAQEIQFGYDADGNVTSVTDGRGEVTTYAHDANGNVILVTDPNGNTVTRTYDAQNRLITELTTGADRDGPSVAHYQQYVYDSEGHLRFAINAAGQTTEYRYTASGQLARTIQYAEHRMTPPGAAAISEATAMAWVAGIADQSSVRITQTTYDARGNAVTTTAYGIASTAGEPLTSEGTTTAYLTYNQAGNLIERHAAGGVSETFVYDGMGRLTSSVDVHGGTTTIVFNDASTTTTITTALGYTSVSTYNKAGDLVSKTDSGTNTVGGTESYQYDAAGRLRVVTDATGRKSYFYYDKAGRKVAQANHLGGVTEYRYDAAGRMIASVTYANALGGTALTAMGNPASTADFSTLRPSSNAADVWGWSIYDDAGNLIQQIDNLGGTVTYEYDTENKLAKSTAFFNALTSTQLAGFKTTLPTAQILPASHAKDAVSRIFYNKAGQQIGTLDGEGYLTELTRDGAGLEIQRIIYAGQTNAADRATANLGTLKAQVSGSLSTSQIAYSVYDGQGLLRYTVNVNGAITGLEYDAAGRLTKTTAYTNQQTLTDFTYDAVKAAVTTNAADRISWTVYDTAGRAAYTVDAEGGVTAMTYDTQGRVTKIIAYDNTYGSTVTLAALNSWASNTAQTSDAKNRITRSRYSERGELLYGIDAEGFATRYTYDAEGRVLSKIAYGGNAITVGDATTIAQINTLVSGVDAANIITVSTTYDNAGRVLTVTTPTKDEETVTTRNVYNALGQLTDVIVAAGTSAAVTTRYTYDNAGRVLSQTNAFGTADAVTVQYGYDGLGNKTSVTDARGNTSTYTYDRLGQVLTATNALSGVVSYTYDGFGNVVKITDPKGNATYNYYDRLERIVATRDAAGYVTITSYNRFNEVVETKRYTLAMTDPGEVGIAVFNPDDIPQDPFVEATQLQQQADALDTQADAAESAAALAQANANTSANNADDADDLVANLEAQIAALGGAGISFNAERAAALANLNVWLNDRSEWLGDAKDIAGIISEINNNNFQQGEASSFENYFSDESRAVSAIRSLINNSINNDGKSGYVNYYYDALTWRANNLGSDRPAALASPLAWLNSRLEDLENQINGLRSLINNSASGWSQVNSRLQNASNDLEKLWVTAFQAAYDLTNNTYSGNWGSTTNLFESVALNAQYLPSGITHTTTQAANYRANGVIKIYFDVRGAIGAEPVGTSPAAALQAQLVQALAAADTAHTAAVQAQTEASAASVLAVQLRASAVQTQVAATAALAAAQSGTVPVVLGNFVLIDPSELGSSTSSQFSYDRMGRVTLRIDAGGYVETSSYSAFGQIVSFNRYAISSFDAPGSVGPTQAEVSVAYAAAAQAQATAASAQNAANVAASNASAAAATAASLQNTANASQTIADGLQTTANNEATAAAQAQGAADAAQAAADQALAYAVQLEFGDQTAVQAAYAAATQAQDDADDAQAAATAAASNASQAQTAATAAQNTANQAATAAIQADSTADSAEAAAATAQTTANQAAAAATTAQNTANTKRTTANASAVNATSLQTTANTLATQLSQNVVAQAYASPVSRLQAYSNALQGQITAQAAQMQAYPPEQQYFFYLQNVQPLIDLQTAVNAEITSVQNGNPLSASGKTWVNQQAAFTTTQLNTYNTLATNAANAQTSATAAQATATADNTAANTAQTAANTAATNATQKQTLANTAQTNATSKRTLSNQAATTASQAATAAVTANQAASTAQAAATQAQNDANEAQDAADAALAYAQSVEANSVPQGTPQQIADAHAAATAAQGDADDAQALADVAHANAAAAQALADTAQADADIDQAAAVAGQANAAQMAATANTVQNTAYASQAAADAALSSAQQLEAGPVGGVYTSGLGAVATTAFEYDERGQLTKSTDALGFYENYTYDAFGRRVAQTAKSWTGTIATGGTTSYTYDKRGLLIKEQLPIQAFDTAGNELGAIVNSYQYDQRGNLTVKVEGVGIANARTTTYAYDNLDRLKLTTHQQITDAISINAGTNAVVNTAAANQVPKEQITYDNNGNVITTVDAAGAKTVFFYDALNRKVAEIGALGAYTTYQYDANGNITNIRIYETAVTVPANGGTAAQAPSVPSGAKRETTFTYNNLDRMLASNVLGATTGYWTGSTWSSSTAQLTTSYEYDYLGNVVKAVDPNGNSTFSYYDRLSRKTAQVDTEGYLTSWTYNSDGNVLTERRNATRFTGTVTTANPPSIANHANDRLTTYTYDKNGNRLSEARSSVVVHNDAGGTNTVTSTVSYLYNGLGQVVRKTEATGEQFNYLYDAGGRLRQETRPKFISNNGAEVAPTLNYFYDSLGNLVRNVQAAGGDAAARVTTYKYETGGRLKVLTDAEGGVRNYLYDTAGRLVLEHYSREVTATNGLKTTVNEGVGYRHDVLGRSLGQGFYVNSGSAWQFQSGNDYTALEYNAFGDVTRTGLNGLWQQENKYDVAGRMWASSSGDGIWKYFGYDRNGNQTVAITSAGAATSGKTFAQAQAMISQADVNGTYTVYNKRNEATSVVEEDRQLVATGSSTLTTSRTYNAFGEVATETNAAGAMITYTYNTMGRLIRSESPAVSITLEDGTSRFVKPSEDYYYDVSGRLEATRDANGTYATGGTSTSKAANTGRLNRLTILAGTGYGGGQALITEETHADGGVKQIKYDVHGDARAVIDELGREIAVHTYNKLGLLTGTTSPNGLIDTYEYDILGRRTSHSNNVYGHSNSEITGYDVQGRISFTRAFGGDVTEYNHVWNSNFVTSGLTQNFGGWTVTTTYRNTINSGTLVNVETSDSLGRVLSKTNIEGQVFNYTYDFAGRQTKVETLSDAINYSYYNTGMLRGQIGNAPEANYTYNSVGLRITEAVKSWNPATGIHENVKVASVVYDALGRMISFQDEGGPQNPGATIDIAYDAMGNVVRKTTTHAKLDYKGNPDGTTTQERWYRYDSMNRMVISDGVLSFENIGRGTGHHSSEILYDMAGQRVQVITSVKYENISWSSNDTIYTAQPFSQRREDYEYDASARLSKVFINESTTAAKGQIRSQYDYNLLGQLARQRDFVEGSTTNRVFDRQIIYNDKGQISSETTDTRIKVGSSSSDIMRSVKTYGYIDYQGVYALGQVGSIDTKNYKNGSDSSAPDTLMRNSYYFFDKASISQTIYTPNKGSPNTFHYNNYNIDNFGHTYSIQILEGSQTRSVTIRHDENNQVLSRRETRTGATGVLRTHYYRFNGMELGEISNDGTQNINYDASVHERETPAGTGPFNLGATVGRSYSDFNKHYDAINSYQQSSGGGGSYTVKAGDTLAAVALSTWGDASLWYKIAQANGLSANDVLSPGQQLRLPTDVVRNHHNAATFSPYNPSEGLGDVTPTQAKPPKKGCGVLGQILLAAIAIGVTVLMGPAVVGFLKGGLGAIGAGIVGGAATGAASSVVSQAVGIVTGIQDKFNWGGVAMGALGGGIGGGLGGSGLFGKMAEGGFQAGSLGIRSGIVDGALRGMASSALTQGVAVATKLQDKFSWAGVAAAGVAGGVGHLTGSKLDPLSGTGSSQSLSNIVGHLGSGAASLIASAATRSAIEGSSFGDNIMAGLPDVIGQVLGRVITTKLSGAPTDVDPKDTSQAKLAVAVRFASNGETEGPYLPSGQYTIVAPFGHSIEEMEVFVKNWIGNGLAAGNTQSDVDYWVERWNQEISRLSISQNYVEPQGGEADFDISNAVKDLAQHVGDSPIPLLGGNSVNDIRAAADNVSDWITKGISWSEAKYSSMRDRIDVAAQGAGVKSVTDAYLFTPDFLASGLATAGKGIGSIPSALAHPIDSFTGGIDGIARAIDRALVAENTPASIQIRNAANYLGNASSRELAASSGAVAGNVVLALSPAKLKAGGARTVLASEGIPGRVSTLVDKVDLPNPLTGAGYGVNNPPVRIAGEWSKSDIYNALYGRSPQGLGRPQLHHADQMPGSAIHEVLTKDHLGNAALHPNKWNQGVTGPMRTQDTKLHWWYRAQEQGAWDIYPQHIYD